MMRFRSARSHVASELGHGGQNMRLHFQQLTEPIASFLDDNYPHELLFKISIFFAQLKSPALSSRRLPASLPRACGDPIR